MAFQSKSYYSNTAVKNVLAIYLKSNIQICLFFSNLLNTYHRCRSRKIYNLLFSRFPVHRRHGILILPNYSDHYNLQSKANNWCKFHIAQYWKDGCKSVWSFNRLNSFAKEFLRPCLKTKLKLCFKPITTEEW